MKSILRTFVWRRSIGRGCFDATSAMAATTVKVPFASRSTVRIGPLATTRLIATLSATLSRERPENLADFQLGQALVIPLHRYQDFLKSIRRSAHSLKVVQFG